ncbi:hypothetical protein JL100_031015 (plasmid) [Skermanella mucosa]|uniref:hypothetical protein n=1 Tax=Skermanella mucosa TaxID=1789672 RepID=UPI00192B1F18|nr:hypothetical protein [Skermanella mucosa]UEM24639.1 hypothetical protein JL100_031015 [Skermanella mucosa]
MNKAVVLPTERTGGDIDIRLGRLSQLFTDVDPSPFREGTLTAEADEYLLLKAKELPANQRLRIVIHLPAAEAAGESGRSASDIAAAMTGHFAASANVESKRIRELFRAGRRAGLIGFATLATCLLLAWHVTENLPARPITRIVQESFVILGWVSIWKPLEMFLYEWLPPDRRRRLFQRLAAAEVVVRR